MCSHGAGQESTGRRSKPKDTQVPSRDIGQQCSTCRLMSTKSRHFKLTLGSKALDFNHHVHVDTMFLDEKSVVHMVDEATDFTASGFVSSQSSAAI